MRAGSLRKRVIRIPVVVCITSIRQNYTIFDTIHEDGYKAISRFWANLSAHVGDNADTADNRLALKTTPS
jgi:hypothetical protein